MSENLNLGFLYTQFCTSTLIVMLDSLVCIFSSYPITASTSPKNKYTIVIIPHSYFNLSLELPYWYLGQIVSFWCLKESDIVYVLPSLSIKPFLEHAITFTLLHLCLCFLTPLECFFNTFVTC